MLSGHLLLGEAKLMCFYRKLHQGVNTGSQDTGNFIVVYKFSG